MKIKINMRKAILWGAVLIVFQMILGNVLYMNPIVASINKQFEGHSSIKTFEFIGGAGNWVALTMIFGIILMVFWIFLFYKVYSILPGRGWVKGLSFGILVGILKSVPEAFNQWMVINYPVPLIVVQLCNTFLGLVVFGMILGFLFHRFIVIEEEHE